MPPTVCRGPLEGPSWVPLGSWSQWLVWAVGPGSGVPEASAALPGDGDAGVVPAAPGHWPGLPCAAGAEGGAHGKPSGLAPVLPAVLWVLHTQSSRLCAHEGRGHRSTAPRGQAGGEVWMPTRRPGEACVYTSCTQAQGQAQACRWADPMSAARVLGAHGRMFTGAGPCGDGPYSKHTSSAPGPSFRPPRHPEQAMTWSR